MTTKNTVTKVGKKTASKVVTPGAFKTSVKQVIKRLDDVQALADKAFAKAPVDLKAVRVHLEATEKLLAGVIKTAHGDGGDGPND